MEKVNINLPPFEERRLFKRAAYRTTLEIQSVATSEGGNVFEVMRERTPVKACGISEGGMELNLPFPAKVGSILKIRCRLGPDPGEIVEVFARVMWNKKRGVGVRFLMLENGAREIIRGIVRDAVSRQRRRTKSPR